MRKSLIQHLQDRGVQVRTPTLAQQGAGSRRIPGSTTSIILQLEVEHLGRISPLSLSFFDYKMQRMRQAVVVH